MYADISKAAHFFFFFWILAHSEAEFLKKNTYSLLNAVLGTARFANTVGEHDHHMQVNNELIIQFFFKSWKITNISLTLFFPYSIIAENPPKTFRKFTSNQLRNYTIPGHIFNRSGKHLCRLFYYLSSTVLLNMYVPYLVLRHVCKLNQSKAFHNPFVFMHK